MVLWNLPVVTFSQMFVADAISDIQRSILLLLGKLRPFHNLQEENFFLSLARVVSEGQVLRYIDYHPEIPRNV